MRRLVERMPPGSYLFAVNLLLEDHPVVDEGFEAVMVARLGTGFPRSRDQIRGYYDGLEWVEPGLVDANDWRPDAPTDPDGRWSGVLLAGMGKKP